jgi:cytochrome c
MNMCRKLRRPPLPATSYAKKHADPAAYPASFSQGAPRRRAIWSSLELAVLGGTMRTIIAFLAALTAANVLSAAHAQNGSVEEGRRIAQTFCARCHAIGEEASSPRTDAPPFRYIAANRSVGSLREVLGEGMIVGHPNMPQWRFQAGDVSSLIAYLKSIGGKG